MHSLYVGGDVEVNEKDVIDHNWVTKDELPEYFSGEMMELLKKIIFEFHGNDCKD